MESTVTVVAQTSNWVHKEGAYSPKFYIGTAGNIENHNRHDQMIIFLITGGLLTACLYHLGLFVLNRRRVSVLLFALCCLLLVFMANPPLPLFLPDYNWFAAFRIEYIVHFLTFAMLSLFLDVLFPGLLHKIGMRAYYVLAGVYILLSLVLPTAALSASLIVFDVASAGMIAYILIRLGMALREKKPQNFLAFVGIALLCLFGVNDVFFANGTFLFGDFTGKLFSMPVAMLFFVFCYGLVISLEYSEIEKKMQAAQSMVREAEARYLALTRRMEDTRRFAEPSAYGLSGREKDVLWLLLDGKTRAEIAGALQLSAGTINTYCGRIYTKTKVSSLQELFLLFGVPEKEVP